MDEKTKELLRRHGDVCLSIIGIISEFHLHMSDWAYGQDSDGLVEDGDGRVHHFNFTRLAAINELFCKLSEEQVQLMKEITDYVEPEEETEAKQNLRSRLK